MVLATCSQMEIPQSAQRIWDHRHQWRRDALSTAPQNKVTITASRHSGMLLAGIQKNNLDTALRRYDVRDLDTHLCGAALSHALLDWAPNG